MTTEVKIILPPDDPQNKKGGVFENMVRRIVESHDYEVTQNINFSGLEIDLLAEHNIKRNELLYVECKAKEKPSSTEVKNFVFGVSHKKATSGYFIHTTELDHQAAGLRNEILGGDVPGYEKISFIDPSMIIEILVKANFVKQYRPEIKSGQQVTKRILALSYFGKFYVYILSDGVLPTSFICINAGLPEQSVDQDHIELLKGAIPELADLIYTTTARRVPRSSNLKKEKEIETISEVATGEAWYDYKPTNPRYFVGRDGLLKRTFDFFAEVRTSTTERRIFYFEGKSGWGKSSFIARIRDKAKGMHNKNKYYVYAVDYRSALSNNFASIAFAKMMEKAVQDGFLPKRAFKGKIKIASSYDILSSKEVSEVLHYLKDHNKVLILIFDQFEDAFKQGTLFSSFYKLLNDTNDAGANFVVGFSWKSEINIPADHEAYYLWQQAKTHALEMKMPEFGLKDLRAVTKQLEQEINQPLPQDLKTKLIDISQGFPWLIKKLCIHVYEQYKSGTSLDVLLEEDMNIEALFKQDLEKISPKESKMLHYIARRAYDGKQYDVSETDEESELVIKGLINQRLIIRSGSKHNIYWDIFRDYLVEGKVPEMGEIYLLRNHPKRTYEILAHMQRHRKISINEFEELDKKSLVHGTYQNFFRILRDLGVIYTDETTSQRYDDDRKYQIKLHELESINEQKYKSFLREKFKKYAPVLRLHKIAEGKTIPLKDAQQVVAATFKGRGFNDDTIHAYTQQLGSWLQYSGYEIQIDSIQSRPGRARSNDPNDKFLINFPATLVEYLLTLSTGAKSQVSENRRKKIEADLRTLNLVERRGKEYLLKDSLKKLSEDELTAILIDEIKKMNPVQKTLEYSEKVGGKFTAKMLLTNVHELFDFSNSIEHKNKLANVLRSWAIYINSK